MLRIMEASIDQAEIVANLVNEAYYAQVENLNSLDKDYSSLASFETKEDVEAALANEYKIFLLYKDDIPIGTIRYFIAKNNPMKGYISRFAILPYYSNQEIGSKLMEFAEKKLEEAEVSRVEVSVIKVFDALERFYRGRGYKIKTDLSIPVFPFDIRYMELSK